MNAINPSSIKLIECPRDAMQGWKNIISTEEKIKYLNSLLGVGFHTIDCGSFVSPKAIPQMADTKEVLLHLQLKNTISKLLVIVANVRGAEEAVKYDAVTYLGYPFSISETFQLRNTNKTIMQSLETVKKIQQLCVDNNKQLVIYISMAFGNPYGDIYNTEIVMHWMELLAAMNVRIISLADTVGVANAENISYLFSHLIPAFPDIEIGAHFHSAPHNWEEKIIAAFDNGCTRFDGAIKGYGGCPMAKDDLVGNMATENVIAFFQKKKIDLQLNMEKLRDAKVIADTIFMTRP